MQLDNIHPKPLVPLIPLTGRFPHVSTPLYDLLSNQLMKLAPLVPEELLGQILACRCGFLSDSSLRGFHSLSAKSR